MSILSTGPSDDERLVVSPRRAWHMLAIGNTHGYALLAAGELESYLDGRARRITVSSIHAYIARRLAAGLASSGIGQEAGPRRRRHRKDGRVPLVSS